MSLRIFLFVLLFLSATTSSFALDIPPSPTGYVNDYAHLLNAQTKNDLESVLSGYESQTSNQIVVAVFDSLEGESLEDFSIRLATQWKVGQKDRNNGVILLVFIKDRQLRIEVGYGLEGALPDTVASTIIRNEIIPHFKAGNYEAGIIAGISAIQKAIAGEFSAESSPIAYRHRSTFPKLVLLVLFSLLLVDFVRYSFYLKTNTANPRRYSWGGWFMRFAILLFVLRIVFEIFFRALLMRGGHYGSRSGYSSGGFGGGGGSFGGGGASGRW